MMIKDCKTAYLLGDKNWYPFQSIQLKKQLDFAHDFAAHFNDDEIQHCSHIETHGFKTCPRGWDGVQIKNYLSNLSTIKQKKGNFLELCRRTLLMHDLFKLNEPMVLRLFLEKGVYLGGTPGFPPFLQLFCYYTKSFTKKYNSLFTNTTTAAKRHFKYDVKQLEKSIMLLDEYECDFSAKIWYKDMRGLHKEHATRMIFEELCASITSPILFDVLMRALINRKNNSNYTRQMVNKALKEASIMANHEIVKYLVMHFGDKIDRHAPVVCPLHFAVQGGSLKCVEHLIDSLSSLTCESLIAFPLSRHSNDRLALKGTAYECAKAITRSAFCIEFEEWSEYAEIIDTLKNREQEKREAKKKKKKNTKKNSKAFDPTDKENHEENHIANYEQQQQQQRPNGMSKLFENDLEGLQETFAQFKASGLVATQKPAQKTRSIQTCVTTKEKSVQTISDDSIIRQLEQKDKKINELEKALLKARKQVEKNAKLEKEVTELKAQTSRQAKDLENYKLTKKRHKEQIDSILLKSEETENVLLVEKRENKQLKQRTGDLEGALKALKEKVMSSSSIDSQLQLQIEENSKLKDNYVRVVKEMKKLKDDNDELHGRYKEKSEKLNDAKQVLKESYDEALRLETMVKMYPDKSKMFQMSKELLILQEKIQNRNEFENNGVEAESTVMLDEQYYKQPSKTTHSPVFGLIQRGATKTMAK